MATAAIQLPFATRPPARAVLVLQAKSTPDPLPAGEIGRFRYDAGLTHAQLTVLRQLVGFFDDDRLARVYSCIRQRRTAGREDVSLRTLDWLVTNYSKKNFVRVASAEEPARDLHNSYRAELEFYGRPLFDPFRRGPRVHFDWEGETVDTTCGQLSLFRFLIRHAVLDYAVQHAAAIEGDMIRTLVRAKQQRADDPESKRRRVELTQSDPTRVHVVRL